MKKQIRQARVLEMVERIGYVAVGDAATALSVTMQTIRRDFDELITQGAIIRHRGGATPNLSGKVAHYATRRTFLSEVKKAIARAVLPLIPTQGTIFIETGTTLEAIGPLLSRVRPRRVVTNNLNLALYLSHHRVAPVHILNGEVRESDGAVTGEQATRSLDDYRFDLALIGAAAIAANGDILDHQIADVAIVRAAIARSDRRILAVDATKFRRTAPLHIAPISAVGDMVTDTSPPRSVLAAMRKAGVTLHLAGSETPEPSRP